MPQYRCLVIKQEATEKLAQTSNSESVTGENEALTSLTLYGSSLENEWAVIAVMFPMPASKNKLF